MRDLGGSAALAALVVTLIGIGSLVSNLPASLITIRYGERWAIVGAGVWCALAMSICMFVPHLAAFAVGVFMIGMASAVFALARQTYLTEAVPFHYRARALSTLGGVMRIGLFIGPFLGAAVIPFAGLAGAYGIGVVALVLSSLLAARMPDLPGERRAAALAADSRARPARAKPPTLRADLRRPRDDLPHRRRRRPARQRGARLAPGGGAALGRPHRPRRRHHLPDLRPGRRHRHAGVLSGRQGHGSQGPRLGRGAVDARAWARPCWRCRSAHSAVTLLIAALALGFGNGIGSGMIMTLGADYSPAVGRAHFLGVWRLMADLGSTTGPALLSAATAAVLARRRHLLHRPRRPGRGRRALVLDPAHRRGAAAA